MSNDSAHNTWVAGADQEVEFWDRWLGTKGREWPWDFTNRTDPNHGIAEFLQLQQYIDSLPGKAAKILDVGAGPLTIIGKKHPHKELEIVATDALAGEYDKLLQKYGIVPLVRTLKVNAENLTGFFAENSFDLVYARNCIDHSYDPLLAIMEMVRVVKPGCFVVMMHAENEAETENYVGLHQWNFTIENGDFVIRSKSTITNVTQELSSLGVVECRHRSEDNWIHVNIRKHRKHTSETS